MSVRSLQSKLVVLVFEELHWADPTSLDLLRACRPRRSSAAARFGYDPTCVPTALGLRSHHSLISLSPLDRAGVTRMVGEISAHHALSKELIEGVNERR